MLNPMLNYSSATANALVKAGGTVFIDSSNKQYVDNALQQIAADIVTVTTIKGQVEDYKDAAEESATAASSSALSAATHAANAAASATAANSAQDAAEAAQTAAETAQAGAEQAKDDAQNIVNNFVQTGGPFTNGIIVDKQIILRGNPETDTSESVLQHKEYGFNFYDVEEGTDLSGKSLFIDTGISPLDDSNFNGTSLETLISFQNGYTLHVNPNVSPSNYSVYMATPSGGINYFYLNGQWIADVYTFTGSGWVVESIEKENFESDAAQMLADMITVGTFFVPSRTRFDEGAQIPLTPSGAFDVANKQYVDSTLKTESEHLQQAIDNEASARAAADTALRNSKYDKTGGTIDGNVQITGDLTVQGTTTTNDTETLAVKDNLIVTNSDGATLSGLSGLIIRTSPTQSYGIVYDPANEGTVKLGLGTYNAETGIFTFATGEGLPVAIRSLSTAWKNLHLAAWDAASNRFIDAGKAVADFQEKLTFDTTPTQNSTNPVTSGGVFAALQEKQNTLTEGEGILISDTDVISFDTTVLDDYVTLDTDQIITATKVIQGNGAYVFNISKSFLSTEDNEPNITKFDGSTIMFQRDTGSDRGALILYTEITGTAYRGLKLPYEAGTLALLSDIPSLDGYAKLSTNEDQTFTNDIFMLRNLDVKMTISASELEVSRIDASNRIFCDGYIYIDDDGDGSGYYGTNTGNYYGHMFEVMLDMDSYYVANFPAKPLESQETFAFLSDIEPVSEQVSDLSQSVDDIYTILQQEVYNSQDIEQEYSSRETADGADIIDGALETVKKVQGSTVKTTNLIPFPYANGSSKTMNGITFTVNSDGSITINGTASGNAYFSLGTSVNFIVGNEYYISGADRSSNDNDYYLRVRINDGRAHFDVLSNSSFSWTASYSLEELYVYVTTGASVNNVTVYPMLNEGSSALPYMPYFSGLKNAYFKGLRSTGRNLYTYAGVENNETQFANCTEVEILDGGNVIIAKGNEGTNTNFQYDSGWVRPNNGNTQYYINLYKVANVNISADITLIEQGSRSAEVRCYLYYLGNVGDIAPINSKAITSTKTRYTWTLSLTNSGLAYPIFAINSNKVQIENISVSYTEETNGYEPYVSHEISLDAAIELPAWDSINPMTGKRIVGTNTVYLDEIDGWIINANEYEGKTAFYAGTYPNIVAHADQNPEAICSRLPFSYAIATNRIAGEAWAISSSTNIIYVSIFSSRLSSLDSAGLKAYFTQERNAGNPYVVSFIVEPTESDISMEDRLPAYKNGSETAIQGDTDNSKYGAENTLTQNYAEVKGTTEGGNS